MLTPLRNLIYRFARWSERYTKTDMVYVLSGNFWLSLNRVVGIGSGFVMTVIFANLLSPTEFGIYKYVLAAAGFVVAFCLPGLSAAASKYAAQGYLNVIPALFRMSVLSSIPASLVALAIGIYYSWHGNIPLGVGFISIGLTTPLLLGFGLGKQLLLSVGAFRLQTLISLPRNVVFIALMVSTILLTHNITMIILMYFVATFIVSWQTYKLTIKRLHVEDKPEKTKEATWYGIHMSFLGAIQVSAIYLDQLVLWHVAGPIQLAIYTFAQGPVRELRTGVEQLLTIMYPKLAKKTPDELKKLIPLRIFQMSLVTVVVVAAYIVSAPFLYALVLPQYQASVFASQVIAAGLLLSPKGIMDMIITVHGSARQRTYAITVSQVIKIIASLTLIPLFGIMGAIAGSILSDAISALIFWVVYKKM